MDDLRAGKLKRLKGGTVWAYPCGDHFHIGHQPLWRGSTYPSPLKPLTPEQIARRSYGGRSKIDAC